MPEKVRHQGAIRIRDAEPHEGRCYGCGGLETTQVRTLELDGNTYTHEIRLCDNHLRVLAGVIDRFLKDA